MGEPRGIRFLELVAKRHSELDEQYRIGEMEGRIVAPVEMPGGGHGRLSDNSRIMKMIPG